MPLDWTFSVANTLSGTVTGLTGLMMLSDNNGDIYDIASNGSFSFTTPFNKYTSVYVATQPSGQACSVSSKDLLNSGSLIKVSIACLTGYYVVTPRVYGLNGSVVLQDNRTDNLTVTSSGGVVQGTFSTSLPYGVSHNVTVLTQPAGQSCNVSNGTSKDFGDDVNVFCNANP